MSQKFIYLLDAGHGGLIDGKYTTSGKRSPIWEDGSVYYEGVGNRDIRKKLAQKMEDNGLNYHLISVGGEDTSLRNRVGVINSYCNLYGAANCILISIHSDAFNKESAHGWSVFSTKGTTKSDAVATLVSEEAKKLFPNEKFREDKRDGDPDKEANFYIIANSRCRAILTENFFMTNPRECQEILLKEEGRDLIADAHFNAILRMEKEL
jgi:N-acetylmuramoyl-L-alanine amidase